MKPYFGKGQGFQKVDDKFGEYTFSAPDLEPGQPVQQTPQSPIGYKCLGLREDGGAAAAPAGGSTTGGGVTNGATFTPGNGEQWAGVALPLVRKIFGQIAAKEFVSVQPMNLPSGLVFFLDFKYGTAQSGQPGFNGKSLFGGNGTSTGDAAMHARPWPRGWHRSRPAGGPSRSARRRG